MLSKIKGFLDNNANKKAFYMLILFAIVFIFSGDMAFAWDAWNTTSSESDVIKNFNVVIQILAAIIWFFSAIIWVFIDASWSSWSALGLNWKLHQLWVLVSNVVYFIFAFLLVWIAFMNIVGKDWAEYELKQALPKFIVWILIVPFSWFIVNFVISISAILSVSVIGLPYSMFPDTFKEANTSYDCTFKFTKWQQKELQSWNSVSNPWEIFNCKESKVVNSVDSIWWIMWTYTYWIMRLQTISKLYEKQTINIKDILDLITQVWFNLIFMIVYWLLIIAIWIALLVRWIYLWIFMVISPLFWLMFFLWEKWWETLQKFNFKEFVNLALVPVYVWAALSFWMLFIMVTVESISNSTSDFELLNKVTIPKSDWSIDHNFTITNSSALWLDTWKWLLDWATWTIWTLLIDIMSLVVFWLAVMAALNSSKITGAAISPIAEFWKSVWNLMQNAPMYMPIAPWWQSISSMSQWATQYVNTKYWANAVSTKASDFSTMLWWDKVVWEVNKNNTKYKAVQNMSQSTVQKAASEYANIDWKWLEEMSQVNRKVALEWYFKSVLKLRAEKASEAATILSKHNTLSAMQNDILTNTKFSSKIKDAYTLAWYNWWAQNFANDFRKSWTSEIKEGWVWSVTSENLEELKKWWNWKVEFIVTGSNWKAESKVINVDNSISWVNFAKTSVNDDKDSKVQLNVEVWWKWYWMTFETVSHESFTQNSLDDVKSKLEPDDFDQLKSILKKITPDKQVDFLKKIFPSAASKIDKTSVSEFIK